MSPGYRFDPHRNGYGEYDRGYQLFDDFETEYQFAVTLDFQNVVGYDRQRCEQPRQAEYPEVGNDGQPPLRKEDRDEVADDGYQSQHDRKDDEIHHDGHLMCARSHFGRIVLQLGEGGESDVLYRADDGAYRHVLVLFAAVVVTECLFGVHLSDKEFGDVGIDSIRYVAQQ